MLGKLIKYEWKSIYKVGCILLFALGLATLTVCLSSMAPMWQEIRNDTDYYFVNLGSTIMNMASVFSFFLYVLLMAGAVYAIFIYLVVRFYKSMYTDEGYLLHTLPVTKGQILVSKILVSTVWAFLIYIGMMISLLFIVSVISGESVFEIMKVLANIFVGLRDLLSVFMGSYSITGTVVACILYLILGIPMAVITMFGAVSLGQLSSKYRVLMAILWYVGIMIARGLLGFIIQVISYTALIFATGEEYIMSSYMNISLYSSLIINLLLAVGCYLASYHITSKKLNME
ncbi:MAG: hypothetical protein J1E03_04450 [Acetatifactor sp.]|nr:hypothetical protein [Acetatifactor sp.]